MNVRPTGATILSAFFVTYGLVTVSAFVFGLATASAPMPVVDVSLALLVAVLAIATGWSLWRLSRRARLALLLWAVSLAAFNARLFTQFEHPLAFETRIGLLAATLVGAALLILLYRYFTRICTPAA